MIESLSEDYVRTAKAKGLTDRRVTVRHALRAAIVPVVTIFGLDFAALLAGTVFTEAIFGIHGIGRRRCGRSSSRTSRSCSRPW